MKNDLFQVQPLGKYGQTYLLNKRSNLIYQAFKGVSYTIMGALITLQFFCQNFYQSVLGWPENFPVFLGLIFSMTSIFCLLKFASSNSISASDNGRQKIIVEFTQHKKLNYSYSKIHKLIGIFCGISIIVLISGAIIIHAIHEHKISGEVFPLFTNSDGAFCCHSTKITSWQK